MYRNAQNTFMELLDMGVIPIVNENDTVAVSEIKFGDNDTLSAITAVMVHADMLFLMTDVDCLYDKNPRSNPDAQPIEIVEDIAALQADGESRVLFHRKIREVVLLISPRIVSTAGSALGTGGMSTKIVAARIATSAGVTTVITRASTPDNISKLVRYIHATKGSPCLTPPCIHENGADSAEELLIQSTSSLAQSTPTLSRSLSSLDLEMPPLHTRFLPDADPVRDRHFWVLHGLAPHGTLYIDSGAHKALLDKAGLLPIGVVDVEGNFSHHEAVRLVVVEKVCPPGPDGKPWEGPGIEVGRAIVNYSATEVARIKGRKSVEIGALLGYADSEYVAARQYISFFKRESRPVTPSFEHMPFQPPPLSAIDSITVNPMSPR